MPDLDWAKVQSFASVAAHGSLSAAARATGGSQPTLSRHISSLEEDLGVRLFDRTSEGLVLTAAGREIHEEAMAMSEAANQLALIASGRSSDVKGTVRLTASESFAAYILPELLVELRQQEPQIAIELVASNHTENLLKREADIAIRMYRPTQNDVFTRKVGELPLGIFGSKDYLARRGEPREVEDILKHDFVGYDRDEDIITGFRARGIAIDREFFALRTDAQYVHLEMVLAGYGLGILQVANALRHPSLQRVFEDQVALSLPIWLTAHAELKTSVRVRRVFDFLAEKLSATFG